MERDVEWNRLNTVFSLLLNQKYLRIWNGVIAINQSSIPGSNSPNSVTDPKDKRHVVVLATKQSNVVSIQPKL